VNYLDAVASFTASDNLTLALNVDWYSDDFGDIYGVAGYGTYKLSDRWAATLRVESLERDFDGGPKYTINAATVDLAFTPVPQFRLLMEARVDDADEDIFLDDSQTGELTSTQPTIGIKAIYSFGV
jgi:putative OmpL-like beta-barrel porin-2